MHIAAFQLSSRLLPSRLLLGVAAVMCLSARPELALAQCVAQPVLKMSQAEYEQRVANGFNNETLKVFMTAPLTPTPAPYYHIFWKNIHDAMETAVKSYYDNTYTPHDVVCVSLSDQQYADSDPVLTYGGKKIVLSQTKHASKVRLDGPLGPNAEVLTIAYHAAIGWIDKQSTAITCGVRSPPACFASIKYIKELSKTVAGLGSNFQKEEQDYSEFPVTNGSTINSVSLTQFYEQVAGLSYLNAVLGTVHQIPVKTGDGQTIVVNATFFDPSTPASLDRIATLSLLDFVEGQFIRVLSEQYYPPLFDALADSELWSARDAQSSTLRPQTTFGDVTSNTGASIGIANLLCNEAMNNTIRYGDLLAFSKHQFVRHHISFFCKFVQDRQTRALVATDLLKTSNTFPLSLQLAGMEQISNNISTELTRLSQLTIEQNRLLNEIKQLVGTQIYEAKIDGLRKAIDEAERLAKGPTVASILQSLATAAAAVAGLPNLISGAVTLTSKLGDMPSDSTSVLYLIENREKFNEAGEQLRNGGAALGTLMQVIDTLRANNEAAAANLAQLRQQLLAVQKEYEEFQRGIAERASAQKREYLASIYRLIDLNEQRHRIYLTTQVSLYKVLVKA
jgi:hypothetical protein